MSDSFKDIHSRADSYLMHSATSDRNIYVVSSLLRRISLAVQAERNSLTTLTIHCDSEIQLGAYGGTTAISLLPGQEISSLNQKPGSFDFVISSEVLGKLHEADRVAYILKLSEIARLGVVIVDVFDSPIVRGAQKAIIGLYDKIFPSEDYRSGGYSTQKLPNKNDTLEQLAQADEQSASQCICLQSPSEWLIETSFSLCEAAENQSETAEVLRTISTLDGEEFNQASYDFMSYEPYKIAILSLKKEADLSRSDLETLGLDRTVSHHRGIEMTDFFRKALYEKDGRIARQSEQIRDLSYRIAKLGISSQGGKNSDEYRQQNLMLQQQSMELQHRIGTLQKQFETVKEQNSMIRERNQEMLSSTAESKDRIKDLEKRNRQLKDQLDQIIHSRSWQMTSFLRRQG